jgi:hypothetical protein
MSFLRLRPQTIVVVSLSNGVDRKGIPTLKVEQRSLARVRGNLEVSGVDQSSNWEAYLQLRLVL